VQLLYFPKARITTVYNHYNVYFYISGKAQDIQISDFRPASPTYCLL